MIEAEAILESKIEVLEKKLADCERELKAQRLIRAIEKDIMQDNFNLCKEAAEYWSLEDKILSKGKRGVKGLYKTTV